jgi:hypothetical protein
VIRRSVAFLACILSVLFILPGMAAADPSPTPEPTVAAPSSLGMSLAGSTTSLPTGGWINQTTVLAHFQVAAAGLVPQVEVEPSNVAFTGTPNYTAPAVTAAGVASVKIDGLQDGKRYHWQARVADASGNASSWVPFSTSAVPDLGIDQDPPSRPVIHSPTNPDQNRWYNSLTTSFSWSSHDALSGLQGYSYVLERQAKVIPPGQPTSATSVRLSKLADGVWFLALRAVDRAGNWSPTATYRIQLDRQAPHLTWLSPAKFTYNPYRGPVTVHFKVSKDASLTLGLYRVGSREPAGVYRFPQARAGQVLSVTWNGKSGKGQVVGKGYYFFSATATDHANNLARWNVGGIAVNPLQPHRAITGQLLFPDDGKVIIVSLSREALFAYDGDKLVLQTLVTTGNPSLPTPPGSYQVMGKYHPYEFISPWPPGSPYWYPPSLSNYAMLFREGGYFLHDAPWRSAFGPGTNGPGQPGTDYGGTHGCVNIPPAPMLFLWNWTPVGTKVLVVP